MWDTLAYEEGNAGGLVEGKVFDGTGSRLESGTGITCGCHGITTNK